MALHSETSGQDFDADIIVVGAGPAGLMTANLLAGYGVSVIVIEANDVLIDYPRGVGIDDEALRAFQAAGLVSEVLPHTVPNQVLAFVDRKGKDLARIAPSAADFGWPRRNGFVQPLADRVLLEGLSRFDHAEVLFSSTAVGIGQDATGVTVTVSRENAPNRTLRSRFVVGADGGRSAVRKTLGIEFPGKTAKKDWLVIDVRNDPLGRPGSFVGADPRRPYACISIPHGIRRFEFMMLPGETIADAEDDDFVLGLLHPFVPRGSKVELIRRRVYTHQSRLAERFRSGRAILIGDAAHLMPVWQGQGFNSGIRDAFNLAWKLAAVLKGQANERILDAYEQERRDHAKAMIQLSTWVGNVISVRNPVVALGRDVFFKSASLVPRFKRHIVQMRFKPMPTITSGAITTVGSLGAGSPVGRLFPQPVVATPGAATVKLDEALGGWFALITWNNDPTALLTPDALRVAERAGIRLIEARPVSQLGWNGNDSPCVIGDIDGALQRWFEARQESCVLIRPDRIVGGASSAYAVSGMLCAFAEVIGQPR